MENQSLLKTVEELQSAVGSVEGSSSRILKMEKENQRLSKKVIVIELCVGCLVLLAIFVLKGNFMNCSYFV